MGVVYGPRTRHQRDVTYYQSSTYASNNPATYQYMNDYSANGANNNAQTGTNSGVANTQWIMADVGRTITIKKIVLGYDYLANLPGGWGVTYTQGRAIEISNDNVSWTYVTTAPTYTSTGSTNGLVTININADARYVRLINYSTTFVAALEFQVWGY